MEQTIVVAAKEFYEQGHSLRETSDFLEKTHKLHIHPNTLGYHLKRAGLFIRGVRESAKLAKRKHINAAKLVERYVENPSVRAISLEFRINRATATKILKENDIRILSNDESVRNANMKYLRHQFSGSNQDKAYLYGFVLGDVHVFQKSKFTLRAVTYTTRKCFVDLFNCEFDKYGMVNCRKSEDGKYALWVDLDYCSFSFLEERSKDRIPDWVTESNFISFLSGLIDADGSVLVRKAGKYFQYVVRIFGEDKQLLSEINERLTNLRFRPSFSRTFEAGRIRYWNGKLMRYNKDYFALEVYRKEDTLALLALLRLKHKEKILRRKQVIALSKKGLIRWRDIKTEVVELRKQIGAEAEESFGSA